MLADLGRYTVSAMQTRTKQLSLECRHPVPTALFYGNPKGTLEEPLRTPSMRVLSSDHRAAIVRADGR